VEAEHRLRSASTSLFAAAKDDTLRVLWTRTFSAAGEGEVAKLQLTRLCDLQAIDVAGDVIWHTRTKSSEGWQEVVKDYDWDESKYRKSSSNGWDRYIESRSAYQSDYWSPKLLVDSGIRAMGGQYCGEGDLGACTEVTDGRSFLMPGEFVREGNSISGIITTMTVDGNFLQGLRNIGNVVFNAVADFEIKTRSGDPYLNSVETELLVQKSGDLVLRFRDKRCTGWVQDSSGSNVVIETGAVDCRKPDANCFCAGKNSDGEIDMEIKDEARVLQSELASEPWKVIWNSGTHISDANKRNGPYALVLTTGGDLTLIDGDGHVTWRIPSGDSAPISCATVVGVRRMPFSWEDGQVNLAIYRSETRHPRNPCGSSTVASLTLADPDLVWSTATNTDYFLLATPFSSWAKQTEPTLMIPSLSHGMLSTQFYSRIDDRFHPFCSVAEAKRCASLAGNGAWSDDCDCEQVQDGASSMHPGQVLRENTALKVELGELRMQPDGNLVLYLGARLKAVWSSNTYDSGVENGPYSFVMTSLAELAVADGKGKILWFVDSPKLFANYIRPDHISGMDKLMSPTTAVVSLASQGITGMFSGSPEMKEIASPIEEFNRWRFVLQDDGNLILHTGHGVNLFTTDTWEWKPANSDGYPYGYLAETNSYGDGWQRFDPKSGDTFFQWSKFLTQFASELVGDVVLSIATGGTYAVAKYAIKFGAKAAVAMAKQAIKAGLKNAASSIAKVLTSPKRLATYIMQQGRKGVRTDLGYAIKSMKVATKKSLSGMVKGVKQMPSNIVHGVKDFLKIKKGAGYLRNSIQAAFQIGVAPLRILKGMFLQPIIDLFQTARGLSIIGKYAGEQALDRLLKKKIAAEGMADAVQTEAKMLSRAAMLDSTGSALRTRSLLDDVDESAMQALSPLPKRSHSLPSQPSHSKLGAGLFSRKIDGSVASSAKPLKRMDDLAVPNSLPRQLKTETGELDLTRIADDLDSGLKNDKLMYDSMQDYDAFKQAGEFGAPSVEQMRELSQVRIQTEANWRFQDGIARYGDAIAEQGLDADAILKQHFGCTLDEAKHARTAQGFALQYQQAGIAGLGPSSVDSVWNEKSLLLGTAFEAQEGSFAKFQVALEEWTLKADASIVVQGGQVI